MSGEYKSQTPSPARRRAPTTDTPVPSEDWLDRARSLTEVPASLRHIAARMNETAVGVVHTATSLFMLLGLFVFGIGVLFLMLCVADFGKHHVLGYWPAHPEVERLEQLETENREQRAEIDRLRESLIKRIDQARPVDGEAAQ